MEYLDIYDENGNYLGKEERGIVHKNALWHKTVHCWLYDLDGNIYFQIRKDKGKLYTTASGHVLAGETVQEAFGREVKEELGNVLVDNPQAGDSTKISKNRLSSPLVIASVIIASVVIIMLVGILIRRNQSLD